MTSVGEVPLDNITSSTDKALLANDAQKVALAQMEAGRIRRAREDLSICLSLSVIVVFILVLSEVVGYLVVRFLLHHDFSDKDDYVTAFFVGLFIILVIIVIAILLWILTDKIQTACRPLPEIPTPGDNV